MEKKRKIKYSDVITEADFLTTDEKITILTEAKELLKRHINNTYAGICNCIDRVTADKYQYIDSFGIDNDSLYLYNTELLALFPELKEYAPTFWITEGGYWHNFRPYLNEESNQFRVNILTEVIAKLKEKKGE